MVNFKEIYHFQGSRGGPTFCRGGGVQLFPGGGGSNCLFPIETHIACDFPGGGGPDPLSPPSGSALVYYFEQTKQVGKVLQSKRLRAIKNRAKTKTIVIFYFKRTKNFFV